MRQNCRLLCAIMGLAFAFVGCGNETEKAKEAEKANVDMVKEAMKKATPEGGPEDALRSCALHFQDLKTSGVEQVCTEVLTSMLEVLPKLKDNKEMKEMFDYECKNAHKVAKKLGEAEQKKTEAICEP